MQESTIITISTNDPCYGSIFHNIEPEIKKLYAIGNIDLIWRYPKISIVGARHITPYGIDLTTELTKTAVKAGLTVVSGLAYGVDSIAHGSALEQNGRTIAVLPSSLSQVYPAAHNSLANQIIESGGLLLSEHPCEESPRKHYFIERNRIIAALADQLLVTEAGIKSGTRHTVNFGIKLNKPIAAVPGNINSPQSAYTNHLISEGAQPILSSQHLLDVLSLNNIPVKKTSADAYLGRNTEEIAIIKALQHNNLSSNQLTETIRLTISEINIHTTLLEIRGVIKKDGNSKWRLAK